jgi:hypothetical protein
VFSIHDNWRLIGLGVVVAMAGCVAKREPFGDVVGRSQAQPVEVVAQGEARPATGPAVVVAPAEATVEATKPVEPPTARVEAPPTVVEPGPATTAVVVVVTEALGPAPAEVDRLGARRDWPRSVAYRPSGNVVAWPLYYRDTSQKAGDDLVELFTDPGFFMVDTVLLPVKAVLVPPCRKVVYDEIKDEGLQPAEE